MIPVDAFASGACGSCSGPYTDPECWRDNFDGTCSRCRSCGNQCGNDVC